MRVRPHGPREWRHLHAIKDHTLCQRCWEALTEQMKQKPPKIYYGETMHYRNGREAKNGDKVVKLGGYGTSSEIVAFGVLHSAVAGNDYCNGSIAPVTNDTQACICDMLHVDDLAALLKEKGLDKRPDGK